MEWVLFLFAAAATVALGLWLGVRRGRQLLDLAKFGLPATAKIVARRSYARKSGRRFQIVYEYLAGASTRRSSSFLSESQFDATTEGGTLDVQYLPDRPNVSAPSFIIEQAVEAARKETRRTAGSA